MVDIDHIVARLIQVATGKERHPGFNGILLTPDEIREVLAEELNEPVTQGDPPPGSPEDIEAHPWKKDAL